MDPQTLLQLLTAGRTAAGPGQQFFVPPGGAPVPLGPDGQPAAPQPAGGPAFPPAAVQAPPGPPAQQQAPQVHPYGQPGGGGYGTAAGQPGQPPAPQAPFVPPSLRPNPPPSEDPGMLLTNPGDSRANNPFGNWYRPANNPAGPLAFDSPLRSASMDPVKGFTPGFMTTAAGGNTMPGVTSGYVSTPAEYLVALQQMAQNNGVNAAPLMQQALGPDQVAAQHYLEQQKGQFGLQQQQLQSQGLVDAARTKAQADHAMGLNQATIGLLGALAQNPNMDPRALDTAYKFLDSERHRGLPLGGAPAAGMPGPPPAAPGAAGPGPAPAGGNPLADIQGLARQNQLLSQFQGDFGEKPVASTDTLTRMIDRLQSTPLAPAERAGLLDAIRAGKFGDPAAFQNALYQTAAKNYLMSVGPSQPRSAADLGRTEMQVPFDGSNLFALRSQPAGNAAGRVMQTGGGVLTSSPFNQIVTPGGQVIPLEEAFNPGGLSERLGLGAEARRKAPERTGHAAQLLRDLMKANEGKK